MKSSVRFQTLTEFFKSWDFTGRRFFGPPLFQSVAFSANSVVTRSS